MIRVPRPRPAELRHVPTFDEMMEYRSKEKYAFIPERYVFQADNYDLIEEERIRGLKINEHDMEDIRKPKDLIRKPKFDPNQRAFGQW